MYRIFPGHVDIFSPADYFTMEIEARTLAGCFYSLLMLKVTPMKMIKILDNIPFQLQFEDVLGRMQLTKKNPSIEGTIHQLIKEAGPVAKPKILYKISYINTKNDTKSDTKSGNTVTIDGVEFKSSILKMNLENAARVFPYVITAGRELESIETSKNDIMRVFCLDSIKEMILEQSIAYFETILTKKYALGTTAHMNPGSLNDWPISQQREVFSLFGNVEECIGVKLTESFLMDPIKSVSGIYFPTEVDFKSCMLCTRHPCSKRRAEYNPDLAKKYSVKNS